MEFYHLVLISKLWSNKAVALKYNSHLHWHMYLRWYLFPVRLLCSLCMLAHERPPAVWKTFSKDFTSDDCTNLSEPNQYCSYYNMTCKAEAKRWNKTPHLHTHMKCLKVPLKCGLGTITSIHSFSVKLKQLNSVTPWWKQVLLFYV